MMSVISFSASEFENLNLKLRKINGFWPCHYLFVLTIQGKFTYAALYK
jgi:hypothetical protein